MTPKVGEQWLPRPSGATHVATEPVDQTRFGVG